MEEVHIAFAVDRRYFNQVAVTIASIVANAAAPENLRFHVVHAEDDEWAAQQIAGWAVPNVEAVQISSPFVEYEEVAAKLSIAAMFRTLLPIALPTLPRVIYLDADIIVLHDIADLWRSDLRGAALGGVVDIGLYVKLNREEASGNHGLRDHLLSLDLDPRKPTYVNSGILVMDLEQLRVMDFTRRAKDMHAARGSTLQYFDQDIINSLMHDHIALLDPRWNVLAGNHSRNGHRMRHFVPDSLRADIARQGTERWAIHWTGFNKPWTAATVWDGEAWWRYVPLSGTQWTPPKPPVPSVSSVLREIRLDIRAFLSAVRFRMRKRARKGELL